MDPANDPLQTGGETAVELGADVERCEHNAEFMIRLDAQAIIEQQRLEMIANAIANGTVLPENITTPDPNTTTDPYGNSTETIDPNTGLPQTTDPNAGATLP